MDKPGYGGFYRTYEELKPSGGKAYMKGLGSFYRTYEELKLFVPGTIASWPVVFIVPMRN